MKIHEPVKERDPFFTGWETDEATFDTACPHCATELHFKFKEMLDAAWGWQDRADKQLRESLADVFGLDLSNRSISSGMHAVVARTCPLCERSSYAYFNFRETSNSVYSISLRAMAIEEEN